ncbi:hypothetical protein BCR36DRAFT_292895 [Piromyces finnis]|uniref:Uncharacterized protein n=1 Tax=Piromyces finnis TaxID=1754191 RepID=A0A1Y1V6V9_9FUNG|nr:hypothetical protein BCR36DRAFT_292895 [Piromyces finnis]|eukprot:ORX48702.1 hypothetical protein BCR36DRAFT_292895 [Piromyces finnis]
MKNFLINNCVPIGLKNIVIHSYILSKVSYYASLLGSNKNRTRRVQSLINSAVLWSINSFHNKSFNNKDFVFERNSFISLYALTRDMKIPTLSGICAAQQVKCFVKWRKSNCIIKDLVRSIPPMSHYSWAKESCSLHKKLMKINIKNVKAVKNFYWKDFKGNSIKAKYYDDNKFIETKGFIKLCYEYPEFAYDFYWLLKVRIGSFFENFIVITVGLFDIRWKLKFFCFV